MKYTWMGGEFFLKEDKAFWWKHLSEYPHLNERAMRLHNDNCWQQFEALGGETLVNCDESEGWYLHVQWFGGGVAELDKAPQGLTKWLHILASYVRVGYRNAGITGAVQSLYAFTLYRLIKRH
ncbi:hypothetical protein [Arthronema virus TR020]|uniref:Uncharacterized protein n=1 Tax=Arthronema virus TR020 TaxID=2736280 RepID=A0A7G3WH33_9CAUD|nr:hypothetical protein [Arthronema virus TR020]